MAKLYRSHVLSVDDQEMEMRGLLIHIGEILILLKLVYYPNILVDLTSPPRGTMFAFKTYLIEPSFPW